jgi:hypothetical protein
MTRSPSVRLVFAVLFSASWLAVRSSADEKAIFTLIYRGVATSYDTAAVFVLPGERVPIEARGRRGATYAVRAKDGVLTPASTNKWMWTAPAKPGVYTLQILDVTSDEAPVAKSAKAKDGDTALKLNAFVMVPATQVRNGVLNGYRIGEYPPGAVKQNPAYRPPRGFVEVTKDSADTKVSPHFEIGQFLCKQSDPFPKYLVLDERLPVKLETVIDRLRALGRDVDGLSVMSGYRTPFYNKAIGNVKFSMHQFGGAADVFVDEDRNGNMDDLNADRRIDQRDAIQLFDITDRLSRERGYPFQGGLGHYPATRAPGPFVHIDVRGTAARWAE